MEAAAEPPKTCSSKNVPPTQWVSCKDFFAWIMLENCARPSFATASMRRPCALRRHACAVTKSPRRDCRLQRDAAGRAMRPPTWRHRRGAASVAMRPATQRHRGGITAPMLGPRCRHHHDMPCIIAQHAAPMQGAGGENTPATNVAPPTRCRQRGNAACNATPPRRHHRAHVGSAVPPPPRHALHHRATRRTNAGRGG